MCVLGVGGWSLFCCVVLSVLSLFVIISLGKRELVAFLQMPSRCHVYSCKCYVFLSHSAVSWSTLCDCGIRGSKGCRGSGPPPPEIGFPSNNGPEKS